MALPWRPKKVRVRFCISIRIFIEPASAHHLMGIAEFSLLCVPPPHPPFLDSLRRDHRNRLVPHFFNNFLLYLRLYMYKKSFFTCCYLYLCRCSQPSSLPYPQGGRGGLPLGLRGLGGVLPYMGYIGMCCSEGLWFSSSLLWDRV